MSEQAQLTEEEMDQQVQKVESFMFKTWQFQPAEWASNIWPYKGIVLDDDEPEDEPESDDEPDAFDLLLSAIDVIEPKLDEPGVRERVVKIIDPPWTDDEGVYILVIHEEEFLALKALADELNKDQKDGVKA